MMGFEIATAVRERIPLTVIVFNDGSLNQIRQQQLADYGATSGTELGPLDLAAFADTVGATYAAVATPTDLALALAPQSGVRLIEVPVGDSPAIRTRAIRARTTRVVRSLLGSRTTARLKALITRR